MGSNLVGTENLTLFRSSEQTGNWAQNKFWFGRLLGSCNTTKRNQEADEDCWHSLMSFFWAKIQKKNCK